MLEPSQALAWKKASAHLMCTIVHVLGGTHQLQILSMQNLQESMHSRLAAEKIVPEVAQ